MQASDIRQTDSIHLTEDEALQAIIDVLGRIGYGPDERSVIAAHLLDATLCGYDYSGFPKILEVAAHSKAQLPRKAPRTVHQTPISAMIDGGNTVGMYTVDRPTDDVIARATENGFGVVGVFNSWMTGRSAYYVERIARAGLIGFHTASTFPIVAPPGAATATIGTNPIAFSFPTAGEPLVIDLSTGAFTVTEMALLERRGEQLPEGVAIDAQGQPTRNPTAAKAGALLNFAGYRGFAISLAVIAFGVMAGSTRSPNRDYGYLLVAMRPDLLTPLDTYRQELSQTLTMIKSAPRMAGVDEIRLPSERAFRERERRRQNGIDVNRRIWEAVQALGQPTQ